jgi:hypothetical protein
VSENPAYDPAAEDYAAGRADQLAGCCDVERAVRSEAYRQGQQDERTAQGDAALLERAGRESVPVPGRAGGGQE